MYRVLVVDDEVLVREAISENIRWDELGYELVGSCQNGKEAMEFLERNPVDVVLTDICMPYVDGMELSEHIYNNYKNINIIIFSGFDDFDYAKKAIKYDVEEYLLKPVTAFELSEVLTEVKEKIDKKREIEHKIGKLNETYNKNKLVIESKAIADLIQGSRTQEENFKALSDLDITLNSSEYKVAVINIEFCNEGFTSEDDSKHCTSLMTFSVYNICDEILKKHKAGLACLGSENRIFILFQMDKSEQGSIKIKDICLEMHRMVKKYLKFEIMICTGRSVKNLRNIHLSYEEALETIKYEYILGKNAVIEMDDIIYIKNNIKNKSNTITMEERIDSLMLATKIHDRHSMSEILLQVQEDLKNELADKTKCDLYMQQIVLSIHKLLKASNLDDSEIYIQKDLLLNDLAIGKTLDEAMKRLGEYCFKATDELEMQKNIGGKKQALLAMDYIEKNYSDENLNLNSVCSYLSISVSRFSTIFKSVTGETFMEVLTNIRMQKAKELLENTDYKNYEIAEKVGFTDPHYFGIAFKKMTGKTPSEYSKEKRKANWKKGEKVR